MPAFRHTFPGFSREEFDAMPLLEFEAYCAYLDAMNQGS